MVWICLNAAVSCSCCSTNPCMNCWQSIWHLFRKPATVACSFHESSAVPRAEPFIQQNHQGLRRYAGDGVYSRQSIWWFSRCLFASGVFFFLLNCPDTNLQQTVWRRVWGFVAREHWACCLPLERSVRHSSRAYMMHQADDMFESIWFGRVLLESRGMVILAMLQLSSPLQPQGSTASHMFDDTMMYWCSSLNWLVFFCGKPVKLANETPIYSNL